MSSAPTASAGFAAIPAPPGPDRALEDLVDHVRTRFYGIYRGIVLDNNDPNSLGRIQAQVPAVFGSVSSGWCMPCVPYAGSQVGLAFLPEIGSGVWVAFEGGDVSYPVWVGGYWRGSELPSDVAPDVKVIVTSSSLELKLDDSASSITLSDSNGNTLTLDSSGITLSNGGQEVVVEQLERLGEQRRAGGDVMATARRDYAFPLRIDGGSQQAAQAPYAAHVEQMIEQILLTAPGERVDLPQFGCGLRQLVFGPMTSSLDATLKLQITQALGRWLAGVIQVSAIDVVTSDDDPSLAMGTAQVTITYTLVDTQTTEQTTVTLI